MKKISLTLLICLILTGCGAQEEKDPEMIKFEESINAMCDSIVSIDKEINNIDFSYEDAEGFEDAKDALIEQLNLLEEEFIEFSEIDFPADYDYLEEMADEASAYMTEAVNSYVLMYGDDGYTVNMEEYANENYARAYKRVNIILALLRGETPEEEGLTIQ